MPKHGDVVPPFMGHQYPEMRCFERTYDNDPENQARFVKSLIGFYALANHYYFGNPEEWGPVRDAITVLMNAFKDHHPEFLQDGIEIDSECGGGVYHLEMRLSELVDSIANPSGPPESAKSLVEGRDK